MEDSEEDVVRVAFECLDAALAQIVPDFDRLVIAGCDQVRLVRAGVELDVVDALVVRLHREVGHRRAERPDLDRAVQTRGGERVGVFGVDGDVHDIMRVPFVRLQTHPSASVLPQDSPDVYAYVCLGARARPRTLSDSPGYTSSFCPSPTP